MRKILTILFSVAAVCLFVSCKKKQIIPAADFSFELEDGVKVEMVYVATEDYTMGNPALQANPCSKVHFSRNYWIGRFEITQRQYASVMGKKPSCFKGDDSMPVETVTFTQADTFCKRLNKQMKEQLPKGYGFSLPTEAQWEFAARGGVKRKDTPYSGGSDLGKVGWFADNSDFTTHPVGRKLPNELGIYDMTGNVSEWCLDKSAYKLKNKEQIAAENNGDKSENSTETAGDGEESDTLALDGNEIIENDDDEAPAQGADTKGEKTEKTGDTEKSASPDTGVITKKKSEFVEGSGRVSRGGSWNSEEKFSAVWMRCEEDPTNSFNTLGFRIVLVPQTEAE